MKKRKIKDLNREAASGVAYVKFNFREIELNTVRSVGKLFLGSFLLTLLSLLSFKFLMLAYAQAHLKRL